MIIALVVSMLLCALIPSILFCLNLRLYVEPPALNTTNIAPVSILIPARNEAGAIAAAVRNALRSHGVEFEVVIMDDGSTDGTDAIVASLAAQDERVRLLQAPDLPRGWNGKQHACWALAQAARNPVLCFVDADVSLGPECVARMAQFMQRGGASLVSGFPRQVTGTTLEWLLLPLIHFVLLGFLPMAKMRSGTDPAFAAGCGQFLMARREDYFACGGHSGIKLTMHDGLLLPRLFRKAGLRTDLADITNLASCRMYTSAAEVWSGLAKNATEGLAAPERIVPITFALLLGQVFPFALLLFIILAVLRSVPWLVLTIFHHAFIFGFDSLGALWLVGLPLMVAAAWLPRFLGLARFKQDWRSAVLHPLGVSLLLVLQWYALARKLRGGAVSWRGRAYAGD